MAEPGKLEIAETLGAAWWHPIWEFLIHVFVGTLLFVLIGAPAVGLSYLILFLEKSGVSKPILLGLAGCEYLLFGVDLILFAVFILRQTWKGLLKLW